MAIVWGNILVLVFAHFAVSQHDECGEPTKYPDRRLDDKYLHLSEFKHDDKVEYNCAPGYTRTDGSRISFCKEGRWTSIDLRCEKNSASHGTRRRFSRQARGSSKDVTCSRPSVKQGTVNDLRFSFKQGDHVNITCMTGFNGSGVYTCLHGKNWHPRKPKCEMVKCPAIEILNGRPSNGYVRYNTIVDIICKHGFILRGDQRLRCEASGSWMPDVPKCEPVLMVTCSSPVVSHGGITSGAMPYYKPRDTVTVRCTEGFDLIGSSQITCGPNGQWQALPECRPEVRCSAPLMVNGGIKSGEKPHYKPRDTVTVSCMEGFDLIGSSEITCGPNGQWQALPECRFKEISETGNCGPAPYYPLAHPRDEYLEQKEYTADARVRYKCSVGYRWAGGRDSIYCRNGQWTELQLKCERRTCGSAGEILNGRFDYSGVSFGDSATVICNEGYEPTGRPVRHCRDGGWDGRNAECEPVYCPPPPPVNNADMFGLTYDHVPFGNVVSYSCRTGSLIGAKDIHCTKNGNWSDPPPECRDIICPVPRVPHGSRMMGYRSVYRFGNTVRITCSPGFRLAEENYVKCGIDGEWTPELSKLCV